MTSEELLKAWVHWALKNPIDDDQLAHAKATQELMDKLAKAREALEFGLNEMMPEIKAQKGCWPGEVDDFEDRAREALKEIE
jgi:hypothetical protein